MATNWKNTPLNKVLSWTISFLLQIRSHYCYYYNKISHWRYAYFSLNHWMHCYDGPHQSQKTDVILGYMSIRYMDQTRQSGWASCHISKIEGCAYAGNAGKISLPPRASDPDMHHGTCVTHVPWCMPGSLTSGFLWRQWRGNRSRHSRRMRNLPFYVSGKRPIRFQQTHIEYRLCLGVFQGCKNE